MNHQHYCSNFQRKGLITHLRDRVTVLRPRSSVQWPILSAPQPQLKPVPENKREDYNLMGFQNCVICTTTDIARVKLAVSKTSGAQRGVSERLQTTKREGNINPCAHAGHGNREATICAAERPSVFLLHAPASNLPKAECARQKRLLVFSAPKTEHFFFCRRNNRCRLQKTDLTTNSTTVVLGEEAYWAVSSHAHKWEVVWWSLRISFHRNAWGLFSHD